MGLHFALWQNSELGTNVKNTDKWARVLCVDMRKKGAKSSNVKKYAKSGLKTLQEGAISRSYVTATTLGGAFTLTYCCVVPAREV